MKKVLLLFALLVGAITASADSYTITFESTAKSATGLSSSVNASTFIATDAIEYFISKPIISASYCYYGGSTANEKASIRIGKSQAAGSIEFSLSDAGKVNATSIVISAKKFSGSDEDATLTVCGQTFIVNNSDVYVPYTINLDGTQLTTISISANTPSNKKSNRVYINSIEVVYGSSKTPAGLKFPQEAYAAEYGQTFESPIATANSDGKITYASDKETVATVDANTGVVSVIGEGTAKITATIAETDEFAAGTTSYTLTVTDNREASKLVFAPDAYTVNIGEEFTAPEFSEKVGDGLVTYLSDKPAVATVDESTGTVTIGVAGKATITATIAATSAYKAATASYTITVVDPNAPKFTLVTNVKDLINGTKIIIVSSDSNQEPFAMGKTQTEKDRNAVSVSIVDGMIEPGDDVEIIALEANGDGYALSTSTGYLNEMTSNGITTQENAAKAKITITEDGNATIKFTSRLISYNSNYNYFRTYTGVQKHIQIYALPNTFKAEASMSVETVEYKDNNGTVLGKANLLHLTKPTITINGIIEDNTGYMVCLDGTEIGDSNDDDISGFVYTGKDQTFTVKKDNTIIPLTFDGLTFETAPKIEGVQYLDETDVDGNTSHHVAFYVVPTATSQDLNWVVTAPEGIENGPDIFWRKHDTFKGAACHFYNINEDGTGVPESFEVRISYPIAIPNTPAQGARLMANETNEYTYELYHAAPATLSTTEYAKNEANTSTSGVADVAVDQEAEVEFFNLQGVRVEGELTPGLYIRRQGNQATKVIVK